MLTEAEELELLELEEEEANAAVSASIVPREPGLAESFFPSTTEFSKSQPDDGPPYQGNAFGIGPKAPRGTLAPVNDVLSIPTRAAAAITSDQKFSDPDAYLGKGFIEQVKPAAKAMYGVPEGVTEFVGSVATDPLTYATGVPKSIAKGAEAIGKGVSALNRGSGRLAQELTGVSEEALRLASTKAGRQELRQASGKQGELGNKLSDAIDNYHEYLPEKDAVNSALKEMPPVDISGVIQTLTDAKKSMSGITLPARQKANAEIDRIIRSLRRDAKGFPRTKMTAEEAYQLRKDLDYSIDFDTPEGKYLNEALKEARTKLKNDLLGSAGKSGNKEYAVAMKEWSRKLQLLDKIKQKLGTTKNTREARAEGFIKNLFGRNSANKQEIMKDLDEVFGTDLLKQSKMTFLAEELGPEGKATFLPRQSTGRSTMAAAGGTIAGTLGAGPVGGALVGGTLAAHASPAVATKAVLPSLQFAENAITNGLLKNPRAKALGKAFKNASTQALKARIATQIQKELEKENQE